MNGAPLNRTDPIFRVTCILLNELPCADAASLPRFNRNVKRVAGKTLMREEKRVETRDRCVRQVANFNGDLYASVAELRDGAVADGSSRTTTRGKSAERSEDSEDSDTTQQEPYSHVSLRGGGTVVQHEIED